MHLPGTLRHAIIVNAAALRNQVQLPEGQSEQHERDADEDGPIWLKRSQVSDPRTADAETQEEKWPNTTDGRSDTR